MSTSPIFLFLDKAKDQWQPVEEWILSRCPGRLRLFRLVKELANAGWDGIDLDLLEEV